MIVGTFVLTVCAVLLGGTLAVFMAIWLVFYCPKKLKKIYTQIVNLLAGIPSIVYGLFGYNFLMPFLVDIFHPNNAGFGLLACTIILSVMILPTITSITKNSLEAVPMHYYEGALALGCSKNQAVWKVLLPAAKSGIILSRRERLSEIFGNLVRNAIKYNKDGGSITVTLDRQGLIVEDTGIGIAEENLDKVFSRFFTVDKSHNGKNGGFGLGLAVAKKICQKAGWKLSVESTLGEGSKFTVKF